MKEMVYKEDWQAEVLEYNSYKGYNYAVISQGVFPCGYVEIPQKHPYYNIDYDRLPYIECHGGLTFSGKLSPLLNLPTNTFWIGWDYGHWLDLCGYDLKYGNGRAFGIAYKTEDVVRECINVINQLIAKMEEKKIAFKNH